MASFHPSFRRFPNPCLGNVVNAVRLRFPYGHYKVIDRNILPVTRDIHIKTAKPVPAHNSKNPLLVLWKFFGTALSPACFQHLVTVDFATPKTLAVDSVVSFPWQDIIFSSSPITQ